MKSRLYLVPAPLGDNAPEEVVPAYVFGQIAHVRHFAVENLRSARRYLSRIGFKGRLDELFLYEVSEHSTDREIEEIFQVMITQNVDMAVISEAGLPAVADPGAALVALAHRSDVEVVPFVGPSSLMMALMSSGLNGQCFAFAGYVPAKSDARRRRLKELEQRSRRWGETQILIETPYRSDALFQDILQICEASTRVCVAANISLEGQYIKTRTVAQWRKAAFTVPKLPAVFLIYA